MMSAQGGLILTYSLLVLEPQGLGGHQWEVSWLRCMDKGLVEVSSQDGRVCFAGHQREVFNKKFNFHG